MSQRKSISDLTVDDWRVNLKWVYRHVETLPQKFIDLLMAPVDEMPSFPIKRSAHCLQTASRALRAGENSEYIVAALFHDIGDNLFPLNHEEMAASMLTPFISPDLVWMLRHHVVFQGSDYFEKINLDPHAKEAFRNDPCFELTEKFCRSYDSPSFDSEYPTIPIAEFFPIVTEVVSTPRYVPDFAALKRFSESG